jgi:predicted phosphodiesterase
VIVAGCNKYDYPSNEELTRLNAQHGSSKAALLLGIPRATYQSHCHREGIPGAKSAQPLEAADAETVSETEILREQVRELRTAMGKSRKQDVRDERIVKRFEMALADVRPKYPPTKRKKTRKDDLANKHEHVLLLSDLHAGEQVFLEETMGMNAYNWSIMLERLDRIKDAILSLQENRPYPIRKLKVAMLGDMLSGTIHQELAETNEMANEECVVQLGHDIARWLEEFVPHYEDGIEIVGVVGNHPRHTKKTKAKQAATDNSDWTFYRFLECYHRNNPAFKFNFPRANFAEIMIAERWRALLFHGDGIRSTMVGVPWGGISRQLAHLEQQFQKQGRPLDLLFCGHYHTPNVIEGVSTDLVMNGSLKGPDEFSLKFYGSGRSPSQVLLTAHTEHGVTEIQKLACQDTFPNAEAALRVAA